MLQKLALVLLLGQLCAQGVISNDTDKSTHAPEVDAHGSDIVITNVTVPTEPPVPTTENPHNITTSPPTTTHPTTVTPSTPPTPTPAPVPKFPANVGTWNVTDTTRNITCIIFTGALELEIRPADNTTKDVEYIPIPKDAHATGNCGNSSATEQELMLDWTEPGTNLTKQLTFRFLLNKTAAGELGGPISPKHYALADLKGFVHYDQNHTTSERKFAFEGLYAYQTEESKSYHCLARESLTSKDHVVLKLERLQLQAFHTTNDTTFGAINGCSLDGYVADIVPIAVGASLAALVAIVLVAYLIGRRRSRARGYQSV